MDLQLWSDWATLWGAVAGASIVYVFTIVAVRVAGRRTLAQLSAYDVIVTVAVGTIAASSALPSDAALVDGLAVLVTFLLLQCLIGALRQRFSSVQRWVDFQPKVVVRDGRPAVGGAPWTAQLTLSDLESRLRQNGVDSVEDVRLAVLEPTGKLTVTRGETTPQLFRDVKD